MHAQVPKKPGIWTVSTVACSGAVRNHISRIDGKVTNAQIRMPNSISAQAMLAVFLMQPNTSDMACRVYVYAVLGLDSSLAEVSVPQLLSPQDEGAATPLHCSESRKRQEDARWIASPSCGVLQPPPPPRQVF